MTHNNLTGYRSTWAEIDLDNLSHNFFQIKKIIAPSVKVMVTVKADAYGHGLVPVSQRLAANGVDYLGVACVDEGIKLREADIRIPILILGVVLRDSIEPLFHYNLTPMVCTEELAAALNQKAEIFNRPINIHIKVDTGMGRLGVIYSQALKFIKKISLFKFIKIEGLFTHFPLADTNRDFTLSQIDSFSRLISRLKQKGIHIPLLHTANSAGTINFPQSHFNMVRPGLLIYGIYPDRGLRMNLKPVLSLKTKIVYVKRVPKGCGISYGHTYVTQRPATVVTLPIGYGDGYPRSLSNLSAVLIRGRRFKISGRICMDQIMVDVGRTPVKTGEEVVLIGQQGRGKILTQELADLSGTIPYEIVCGLGSRIRRVYLPLPTS